MSDRKAVAKRTGGKRDATTPEEPDDRANNHADGGPDGRPDDPRRRRHEAKRAAIVAEAWVLARRDGLAAISLRELAERVDLRQPSLYAYFDSKLALYDAMDVDGYRQLLAAAGEHPPPDDPREALVEFVETCVRFATNDVVRTQLLFQRTIPGFKPSAEAHQMALAFQDIGRQRLQAVGVRDMPTADVFTAIVAGFTHQQVFNDPHGDRWLCQVRRAVDMFLAHIDQPAPPKRAKQPRSRATGGARK